MKGFIWYKINKLKGNSVIGMGYMICVNSEDVLFVVKGWLFECLNVVICQYQMVLCGEYSVKFDIFCDLLVQLLGDVFCIELFVRIQVEGWDSWGNECINSLELIFVIILVVL